MIESTKPIARSITGEAGMKRWATALALLAATETPAQTVVDGSDKDLTSPMVKKALDVISSDMRDPEATQFRKLRIVENGIALCGEINNDYVRGVRVDFYPFLYYFGGTSAIIIGEKDLRRPVNVSTKLEADWLRRVGCLPK